MRKLVPDNINVKVQQLIAYMLLEKTIKIAFKQLQPTLESWILPKEIINCALKIHHIIGWISCCRG